MAMKKYFSNKYNAYVAVRGVLDQNGAILEESEMISQAVKEFSKAVDDIMDVAVQAGADTTGETSAKKLAKEKLAYAASSLAASGAVYAVDRSDVEMEAALSYSYSDIKYGLDQEALHMSMAIEAVLLDHRDALSSYLVSDQDLQDLHQKILDYSHALDARGGAKSGVVAQNQRLTRLFRSTDDLLERKMDRIAFRLKNSYPDFYLAYCNARQIIDL